MARYEGFVTGVREDGSAEVIIQPEREGIPGAAPCVNRRVCHCASESSVISIVARNEAGAGVGDRVSVNRSTAALVRNALALLGIPLAALGIGIASAVLLIGDFTAGMTGALLTILPCLGAGIVLGVMVFRRGSSAAFPVIDRIMETSPETARYTVQGRCPSRDESPSCNACSGSP
ncbi:MAG: SoxR reducing system RseC family protein [Thermodesulfobacteriota bacterium]